VQPVLSLYIVVEIIITAVSAMEALRPLLLYRFLVIIFAYEVRYGALLVRPPLRLGPWHMLAVAVAVVYRVR